MFKYFEDFDTRDIKDKVAFKGISFYVPFYVPNYKGFFLKNQKKKSQEWIHLELRSFLELEFW